MSAAALVALLRRRYGPPTDDAELLRAYADHHDELAFRRLVERHGPLVWRLCRRLLGDAHAADDGFQAVFLTLARRACSLRHPEALAAWLYGVAKCVCANARTGRDRRRVAEARVPLRTVADPVAELSARELLDALDEELDRLPERYRLPLVLVYWQGLTQPETARRLGLTPGTLRGRLDRGRAKLAERLTRRGFAPSAVLVAPLAMAAVPADLLAATAALAADPWSKTLPAAVLALAAGGGSMKLVSAAALSVALVGVGLLAGTWRAGGVSDRSEAQAPVAHAPGSSGDGQPAAPRVDRYGDPLPPGAAFRLGTVRYRTGGNDSAIRALSFFPDSTTLVTASEDGRSVQFWDANTGKRLREIRADPSVIRRPNLTLSPDGAYSAATDVFPSEAGKPRRSGIRVWETSSDRELRTFPRIEQASTLSVVTLSPNGKLLISLDPDGVLRVEDVISGAELRQRQFPRDTDLGGVLAISPDGSTLAITVGLNNSKFCLWKWKADEEPREMNVQQRCGRFMAFAPNGQWLAECGNADGVVRVWDVANGRLVTTLTFPGLQPQLPLSVAISPDGKTLFASGQRADVSTYAWDTATWQIRRRFHPGASLLHVSPDSKLLAGCIGLTGSFVGSGIRLWDLASGRELSAADEAHVKDVAHIAVTGDLAVTASDDPTIRIWNLSTGRQVRTLTHNIWIRAIALSPDGAKLVSSSLDNTVRLWDVATGQMILTLTGHGRRAGYDYRSVGFTADGQAIVSWGEDMCLRKWDAHTGKLILEHVLGPTRNVLPNGRVQPTPRRDLGASTFSPDGTVFVLNTAEKLQVFDVATGRELHRISKNGLVTSMTISPDGKALLTSASGNQDHPVCLYELATGQLRKQFSLPGAAAGAVAFSADGKFFATASAEPDPRIQVWDVMKGNEVGSLQGFRGRIGALAFSPDGRRLISGMDDTTALVWDVQAVVRGRSGGRPDDAR